MLICVDSNQTVQWFQPKQPQTQPINRVQRQDAFTALMNYSGYFFWLYCIFFQFIRTASVGTKLKGLVWLQRTRFFPFFLAHFDVLHIFLLFFNLGKNIQGWNCNCALQYVCTLLWHGHLCSVPSLSSRCDASLAVAIIIILMLTAHTCN